MRDFVDDLVRQIREADLVDRIERSVAAIDQSHAHTNGTVTATAPLITVDGKVSLCMHVLESAVPSCEVFFPVTLAPIAAAAYDAAAAPAVGGVRLMTAVTRGEVVGGELTITDLRGATNDDNQTGARSKAVPDVPTSASGSLLRDGTALLARNDGVPHPVIVAGGAEPTTLVYEVPFFDPLLAQALADITGFTVSVAGTFVVE